MGINVLKKKDIETSKMDQYLDIPNLVELLISNNQRVNASDSHACVRYWKNRRL